MKRQSSVVIASCSIVLAILAVTRLAACETTSSVRLVFAGDIMLDDGPGKEVAKGVDPFADFADDAHGRRLHDRQSGVRDRHRRRKGRKAVQLSRRSARIPLLMRYFDAVGVANNHSGDFGPEALVEQCERLEAGRAQVFWRRAKPGRGPRAAGGRAQGPADRDSGLQRVQAALVRGHRHAGRRGLERRRAGGRRHQAGPLEVQGRPGDSLHALGL